MEPTPGPYSQCVDTCPSSPLSLALAGQSDLIREDYSEKSKAKLGDEDSRNIDFNFHFENLQKAFERNMTYLCYRLERLDSSGPVLLDAAVLENVPGTHVEMLFLNSRNIQELKQDKKYRVTWYISWSPCAKCAQKVSKFLEAHSNVSLHIFASHLYYWDKPETRQGLRDLQQAEAQIQVMSSLGELAHWMAAGRI
ncbi:PREDICTED: DNA dC-_dU-editing enzyme APOBEC3-like [Elephantulus edwardii]|uniref:DNA dC->dU-editing enzyme APOBEC3-like n=1 Tax=Elephantulus edwardii TaxID=28737 RepID=UPI0003F0CA8D|nr:PREDICTED: DNA dC->dU-editing enzyme APOBEC3-like [Elephantulus edwardii]